MSRLMRLPYPTRAAQAVALAGTRTRPTLHCARIAPVGSTKALVALLFACRTQSAPGDSISRRPRPTHPTRAALTASPADTRTCQTRHRARIAPVASIRAIQAHRAVSSRGHALPAHSSAPTLPPHPVARARRVPRTAQIQVFRRWRTPWHVSCAPRRCAMAARRERNVAESPRATAVSAGPALAFERACARRARLARIPRVRMLAVARSARVASTRTTRVRRTA